jgi:hypothetical protein
MRRSPTLENGIFRTLRGIRLTGTSMLRLNEPALK